MDGRPFNESKIFMRQLRTIISVTVKEIFRNKLIGGFALFGLVLIASSNLISKFTMQEQLKFIRDLGLSGIAFIGQIMAIVAGSSVISDDYEKKTINQVLTNPVKPYQYILGRYCGIAIILFINIAILTVVFYGSLVLSYITQAYRDMPADVYLSFFSVLKTQCGPAITQNLHLLAGIWLIFMQLLIIASIALLLSFFFSRIINFVICIVVFIFGHLTLFIDHFCTKAPEILKVVVKFIFILIPSFEYFNISDYLVLNRLISVKYQMLVMCYGFVYITPVLLLAILIFDRKEIK